MCEDRCAFVENDEEKGFNREDLHAWRMVTLQTAGTAVREKLQFLLPVSEDVGTNSVATRSTNSTHWNPNESF